MAARSAAACPGHLEHGQRLETALRKDDGPGSGPRRYLGGMPTMSDGDRLVSLVQQLSREAQRALETCGRRELDTLEVVAQQYLKLYRELKARGVIE